jgi:MoaA/NifB/PqqE/SkfB family radical SAM enzyme
VRGIVAEANELGISFFVIAGGEPLTRPEIVDIARDFPHIVFLLRRGLNPHDPCGSGDFKSVFIPLPAYLYIRSAEKVYATAF